MSQHEARKILQEYINGVINLTKGFDLPIFDEVAHQSFTDGELKQYTFRYLLKIAYHLKDNE